MLIRFFVQNFLSFNERTEFSMIKGSSRRLKNHVIEHKNKNLVSVLKSGVIYGANASGKSNLIKSAHLAASIIKNGSITPNIEFIPFKLDKKTIYEPSVFQFDFIQNGKMYSYGFKTDTSIIHEEWLYELDNTNDKLLFERKKNHINFDPKLHKNKKDKQFLEFIAKGTPTNKLFLKESIDRNLTYFIEPFKWFMESLVFIFPHTRVGSAEFYFLEAPTFKNEIDKMLKIFDPQIIGIESREVDFEKEISDLPNDIKNLIRHDIIKPEHKKMAGFLITTKNMYSLRKENNEIKAFKLMTTHKVKNTDSTIDFEIAEESDGTRRLIDLMPALFTLLIPSTTNKVFFIDELDRSLHPHLTKNIIELFLNNNINMNKQLVVSTHESCLLDLNLLRKDEIWFVEKNKDGESHIYSLEEFHPRADKDIRKGYLQGRFGAIPFLAKNVKELKWTC